MTARCLCFSRCNELRVRLHDAQLDLGEIVNGRRAYRKAPCIKISEGKPHGFRDGSEVRGVAALLKA